MQPISPAGTAGCLRGVRRGALAFLTLVLAAFAEPMRVIFDTDIDGDNDDVAAAAILHALADAGRVEILAMGVVSRHPYSPACLDAINTYYGRGDIPIGVYKGTTLAPHASSYAELVAARCPNDLGVSSRVPDVVRVYRGVLAGQPDGKVTMIAVGQMNNLLDLLGSAADEYSNLTGRELVRRKIRALYVMAPYFNERNEYQRAYNFTSSPKAAVELTRNWPTPIKFGEGNLGHRHFIGQRLSETPPENPARIAFDAYFASRKRRDPDAEYRRHCADPTTVLYAVTGTEYFGEIGPGACDVREDGYTRWNAGGAQSHFYNTEKLPIDELESVMEQLLIKSPKRASRSDASRYSICRTWNEVLAGEGHHYAPVTRVSDPWAGDQLVYTGFWFYDALQFDESGRYALAMKVNFQGREVTPGDRADIGYIDLRAGDKWTKIGETSAWNWQQGSRLQWRPHSSEILWNDRAEDGSHFVCQAYNFKTGARRTLPRPIYDVSRDGTVALTHDFRRMKHGGTEYVGISDPHAGQIAPRESGVEKMDLETGRVEFLISLEQMAAIAFPQGYSGKSNLYFFREGWNPSGSRFIAFLKNADPRVYTGGWSISADGQDVRFLYNIPSHHTWQDDTTILEGRHFMLYQDDGTGKPVRRVADVGTTDFDPTILPGGNWILGDTYVIDGYQHLFLLHRPTGVFVPLARLVNTAPPRGMHRVDLHARTTRDGRTVCIDASHEGFGRQMYLIPIGHILDHPPGGG